MKYFISFVIAILFYGGCVAESPDVIKARQDKDKVVHELTGMDYREIRLADSDDHKLVGYMEISFVEFEKSNRSTQIYYIKDTFFNQKGFFTPNGITYKYDSSGKPVKIGEYSIDVAINKLLDFRGKVLFKKFEGSYIIE